MQKHDFDLGWEFSEVSGMEALLAPDAWRPVNLPHDAMIAKPRSPAASSGGAGGFFPGSVANYRKKFLAPAEWQGQSVQLEFEGVYMNAEVSVNHHLLRLQPYGYSSFSVDITPYLAYGQENLVNVVANNTAQPNSRWYSGTGIYRHVWLRVGGDLHIQPWGVFVTTPVVDPEASVVQVATELASLSGNLDGAVLRSSIWDGQGALVSQVETPIRLLSVQQTMLVKRPKLWSVEQPNLYTLISEVLVKGAVVDSERTTFGIRSIAVDAQHGFRLNGVPMKLRGGCIHHDHGPLGAASFDRAEERKVELLKSAGYNALRTAHNPPAPALLDACDRLGMLVIDEAFDCWTLAKTPNDYHLNFNEWWQRDLEAMVKRDRNHPSVIMWSIGNEILEALGSPAGAAWSQRLADHVRSLDSTRLVTSGLIANILELAETGALASIFALQPAPEDLQKDTWGLMTANFIKPLDVAGYNYMPQRYAADARKFPGRVIAGTETWTHMAYYFWAETERLPHVIGDFVWTAMDYIGEAGIGAVTFDGRPTFGAPYPFHLAGIGDFDVCGVKKPQSYYRELLWGVRTAPFIAVLDPQWYGKDIAFTPWGWEPVLDNWTFPGQEGKLTRVDVYAIDDEVELFVNGASVGRKAAGTTCQNKVSFEVAYQPGIIEAVGYKDGKESGRTRLTTTSAPAMLRLTPDRSVIRAGGSDIAYVTIEVQDTEGRVVKHGEPLIALEMSGAGELLAIGTGNPVSEEMYVGNQRKAFQGRLLAIVRSSQQPGEIILTARMESLPAARVQLWAK